MKTLVVYLMSEPETPELAEAAVEGGADVVELGFPFSDPLADGPVIRAAAERALARGMRTAACLECLARVRERVDVPLVPMTYSSLLEAYGWERFALDASAAGASSLIVADLPAGERPELRRIQLVAPTSTDERLALAARETDGWLYLVTLTGTTGARDELSSSLADLARRARALGNTPLYAGFGITTPSTRAGPPSSPTVSWSVPAPCRRPTKARPPCATTCARCATPWTRSAGRGRPGGSPLRAS